jgi:hypothetical protein
MPWQFLEAIVLERKGDEASKTIEGSVIEISDTIRRKM